MPRIAHVLPLLAISFLGTRSLAAQVPGLEQSATHPMVLALKEWDTLQLTPGQVDEIRRIQEEMSGALLSFAAAVKSDSPFPSLWWSEEEVDEAALRAAFRRTADRKATFTLRLLQARDEVYEVLNAEQRRHLRDLQRREVERHGRSQAGLLLRPCTRGGAGGGFELSPRVKVSYSVEFHGDSARIGVVFLARAEDRLYGVAEVPPKPALPDSVGFLSGGTAGRWYLRYDERRHVAWVEDRPVRLGKDNVVLVHGVDSLHDPPRVVGTLRVPSAFYTGGCGEEGRWTDALQAHLEQVPEIRAFIGS